MLKILQRHPPSASLLNTQCSLSGHIQSEDVIGPGKSGIYILRELQIDMRTGSRIMKQIPIVSRLFDHGRVQRIPRRPPFLVTRVAVYDTREERLRGVGRAAVRGAREFVDGEGQGQRGEADVESFLYDAVSVDGRVDGRVWYGMVWGTVWMGDVRREIRLRVRRGARPGWERACRRWRRASCCFRGGEVGGGGFVERTALVFAEWLTLCFRRIGASNALVELGMVIVVEEVRLALVA